MHCCDGFEERQLKSGRNLSIGFCAVVASLAMMSFDQVRAHGGDNWEPFTIDGVNDDARGEVLKVHTLMADVIRGRAGSDDWPVDGLKERRDKLLTVKEVIDEILEHYLFEGINVQTVSAPARSRPRIVSTRCRTATAWVSTGRRATPKCAR